MTPTQKCPICSAEVDFSQKYPKYVCSSGYRKAVDENNRPLKFYDESRFGEIVIQIYEE